jgi:hypothetical protein
VWEEAGGGWEATGRTPMAAPATADRAVQLGQASDMLQPLSASLVGIHAEQQQQQRQGLLLYALEDRPIEDWSDETAASGSHQQMAAGAAAAAAEPKQGAPRSPSAAAAAGAGWDELGPLPMHESQLEDVATDRAQQSAAASAAAAAAAGDAEGQGSGATSAGGPGVPVDQVGSSTAVLQRARSLRRYVPVGEPICRACGAMGHADVACTTPRCEKCDTVSQQHSG